MFGPPPPCMCGGPRIICCGGPPPPPPLLLGFIIRWGPCGPHGPCIPPPPPPPPPPMWFMFIPGPPPPGPMLPCGGPRGAFGGGGLGRVFCWLSNWLSACFVGRVTTGTWPCSVFFGSRSMQRRILVSEPIEMAQKPLDWPLARFSKNLTSWKSLTPISVMAVRMSWSVVHCRRSRSRRGDTFVFRFAHTYTHKARDFYFHSTHPSQVANVQLVASSRVGGRGHVAVARMVVVVVGATAGTTSHSAAICLARLAVPIRPVNRHAPAASRAIRVVPALRIALATRRHHHVVVQVHTAIATGEFRVL